MTRESWLRHLHIARRVHRRRRAALALLSAGERPIVMLCRPGAFAFTHWLLIARAPLTGDWQVFLFDDEGPVGDYGPSPWARRGQPPGRFAGCVFVAVHEFHGDPATARDGSPSVDTEIARVRLRRAASARLRAHVLRCAA